MMNVLVIGAGGREHALAWKIARSPLLDTLYCAPGNGGTDEVAVAVDLDVSDHAAVIEFCQEKNIDLVVAGPEAPLVAGLADALNGAHIPVFGPSAAAAQLEGSKGFTKDICARYNIPTASYKRFTNASDAKQYVAAEGTPIVVKADGLAAGKGVIIAHSQAEADAAIDDMFAGEFGAAGAEVVIETFLQGEEASFFALVDGTRALALATAQDHKTAYDGDKGPNTGGMGAYSPAPVMTDALCDQVMRTIINPTARAMAEMGHPFKGILFAGLMITGEGPQLIEYNVRFGDPECQVLMARLQSDLLPLLLAVAEGDLSACTVTWDPRPALSVVLASKGYPGPYEKGTVIEGLEDAGALPGVKVFHAGTRRDGDTLRAAGGRVLNVTAVADSVAAAQALAYQATDKINWPDGFCRRDIGWRAVARENKDRVK